MIRFITLFGIAVAGGFGQPAAVKVAAVTAPEPNVSLTLLRGIENGLDGHLAAIDVNRPVQNLRDAFAVYLPGYGVAITTELDIMATPFNSPVIAKITDEMRAQTHKQKLERLPVVVAAMKDEMRHAALALQNYMPDNQMIVLFARIKYWPWEDITGLPRHQVILTADRKAAGMGDIKTVYE